MTGRFPRQFGKYVLLKPLAKGGMGEIYLAAGGEVGGFEKLCVIKKVITEKLDRTKSNRFLDEAKVVLRLSHSALVNTFDAGEVNGEFYIAMELIEGKDLREVWNRCVRTRQRIPLDVALHVVREVARALAYVHDYGDLKLVHRDVAPPNILLAYVGDVKLTDFGLARSVLKQEHTAPGVVFGRAAYLSPEQARGEMADARTDVYTLGIVLWELLTGQQFLQLGGLDPAAALALVRNPRLVAPSTRAPWITPALDQVALRALSADRERRFQSAEELRSALTTVIAEIAPTADSARVADFLHGIYAETIADERAERERFLKEEINTFRTALARGVRLGEEPSASASNESPAASGSEGGRLGWSGREEEGSRGAGESGRARRPTGPGLSSGGGRPSTPRLPGMPEPSERLSGGERASADVGGGARRSNEGAAPAFLTAFQADAGASRESRDGRDSREGRDSHGGSASGNGHSRPAASSAAEGSNITETAMVVGRYRVGRAITETPGERLHQGQDPETKDGRTFHFYRGVHRPEAVEAWKKAVRAGGRVRHPQIAELHDALVSDKGRPVAVHEALAGVDLGTLLSREQRFDPGLALRVARQLCEALAASHESGSVHGGLRPTCVFLDGQKKGSLVKLLGFGVTRLFGLTERPQAPLVKLPTGILEYLAPETLGGAALDPRADLYGVGTLLYEMVTGVPPYAGSREAVERKKQQAPQSPRFFRPDLPAPMEDLILRLCAPTIDARPDSAAAVLAELAPMCRAAGPGELPGAGESEDARRRGRRQAAFKVIAELAGEVTGGPMLLEAMLAGPGEGASPGRTGRGPAAAGGSRSGPPPVPARAITGSSPALPGLVAAEASAPAPRSMAAPVSAPAILTSAVGSPDTQSGGRPPPRPVPGGGLLARYGYTPESDSQRKRLRTLVALAVVGAVAVAVVVKMFTGDDDGGSGHGPSGRPAAR